MDIEKEEIYKPKIGDKFIKKTPKGRKELHEVYDIRRVYSERTGELVSKYCVSFTEFLGQKVFDYEIPMSMVILNRIKGK